MTGWKDWTVGEVVTEPEFQSFIQNQVVQVYASSAARSSALGTAVSDGMISYLKDVDSVEVFDSSAWVQVGAPTLTASRAVVTGTAGELAASTVTAAEVAHLAGVTSGIQTQIDGRVSQTNGVVTTAATGSAVVRNVSFATAAPGTANGMDGDVWLVYTP